MRKVFWDAPYQRTLTTKLATVDGNRILCHETIVFSFSGGQEVDVATINGMPILNSVIEGKLIYYTLPDNHRLLAGDKVCMEINWPRRYRLMRLHFAAELILELVTRQLHIEKIGAHIAENKARIDFVYAHNISTHFESLLSQYNQIIESDAPIIKGYLNEAEQRRFWEIEGFSKVPCGGTHVHSTKEVGFVHLKRKNVGGGKERIEIMLVDNTVLI